MDSRDWYEHRRKGLGKKFISIIEMKISEICEHPYAHPKKKTKYHREAIVSMFPFKIIYAIHRKEIVIQAVFHTKRNPKEEFLKYTVDEN